MGIQYFRKTIAAMVRKPVSFPMAAVFCAGGPSTVLQSQRIPQSGHSIRAWPAGSNAGKYTDDIYWYGTSPRLLDNLRGSGVNNTDISVSRSFSLTERIRLAFAPTLSTYLIRRISLIPALTRALELHICRQMQPMLRKWRGQASRSVRPSEPWISEAKGYPRVTFSLARESCSEAAFLASNHRL